MSDDLNSLGGALTDTKFRSGGLYQSFNTTPANVPTRRINKFSRNAMHMVGASWILKYRRLHWVGGAAGRYGYQQRKPGYNVAKEKKFGHRMPLVWSGVARSAALSAIAPQAFPTRVKVVLPVPAYIKIRSVQGRPPLGDEMTRTSNDEAETFEGLYRATVENKIAEYVGGNKKA